MLRHVIRCQRYPDIQIENSAQSDDIGFYFARGELDLPLWTESSYGTSEERTFQFIDHKHHRVEMGMAYVLFADGMLRHQNDDSTFYGSFERIPSMQPTPEILKAYWQWDAQIASLVAPSIIVYEFDFTPQGKPLKIGKRDFVRTWCSDKVFKDDSLCLIEYESGEAKPCEKGTVFRSQQENLWELRFREDGLPAFRPYPAQLGI